VNKRTTALSAAAIGCATILLATPAMAALTSSHTTGFEDVAIEKSTNPSTWRMTGAYDAEILANTTIQPVPLAWDGTSDVAVSHVDLDLAVDLRALQPGQVATLSTTVDRLQSDWAASGSNFERVGLRPIDASGKVLLLAGTPLLESQTNNGATGNPVCVDIYEPGSFLGPNHTCANPMDATGSTGVREGGTLRYDLTVHHDGSWTGSVTPLDAEGNPVAGYVGGTTPEWTFHGQLPVHDGLYAPVIDVRGGTGTMQLTVSDTVATGPVPGDAQLRISNAVTSGSFGDQLFSPTLDIPATEDGPASTFNASFTLDPVALQPGLRVTVSPDNGAGGRAGFLAIEHRADGLALVSSGSAGNGAWTDKTIATRLDASRAHQVEMRLTKAPGGNKGKGNDEFSVRVDNGKWVSNKTFESYYAGTGEPNYRTDTLLFRVSGTAMPELRGKGLLIDDLSISTSM
jgi:hypothetical protein